MPDHTEHTVKLRRQGCMLSTDELVTERHDYVRWEYVDQQGNTIPQDDACIVFDANSWPFTGTKQAKIPFDRDASGTAGAGFTAWFKVKDATKEQHAYGHACTSCGQLKENLPQAGARIIIK